MTQRFLALALALVSIGLSAHASDAPRALPAPPSALECPYGFAQAPTLNASRTAWVYRCNAAPQQSSGTGFFDWLASLVGARTSTGQNPSPGLPPLPLPSASSVPAPAPTASSPAPDASPSANACAPMAAPPWAASTQASGPWWDGGGAVQAYALMPGFIIPSGKAGDRITFVAYAINDDKATPEGYVSGPTYRYSTPNEYGGASSVYAVYGGAGSMGGQNSYSQTWACLRGAWSLERKDVPRELP